MLIGARSGILSGGWKNPYVTDGLIAMWDGIENAGWGVHDTNATVWKDLVGDMDFTIDNSKGVSFSPTSLHMDKRNALGRAYTSKTVKFRTLEIVGKYQNGSRIIFINNKGKYESVVIQVNMSSVQFTNSDTKVIEGFSGIGSFNSLSVIYSATSYQAEYAYQNGMNMEMTSSYNDWGLHGANSFSLGARRVGIANDFGGDFYCVRMYSRALTADEIAANFVIDNARFNLP